MNHRERKEHKGAGEILGAKNGAAGVLPVPYFEGDGVTLYCGDYAEIVPLFSSRFDAVITDPPYGETSLEWDVWPRGWPELVARVSSQLWCFGSLKMFWRNLAEFSTWRLAQEVVWSKGEGSGLLVDRFRRSHEFALHFYLGKWTDLKLRGIREKVAHAKKGRTSTKNPGNAPAHCQSGKSYKQGAVWKDDGKRFVKSVIETKNCRGYAVNETQKPVGIVAPLVAYSVPKGGSVLDCFAGSGTTLVVARSQGKRAVGIEKRESQCAEIVKRLAQGELVL